MDPVHTRGGSGPGVPVGVVLIFHTLCCGSAVAAPREPGDDEPIVTAANNVDWPGLTTSSLPPKIAEAVSDATPPTSPAQQATPSPSAQARVLTPIQGPLMLEGRYLGDISGEVSVDGDGVVDVPRLVDLLDDVLSASALQALRDRIGGRDRVPFGVLRGDGLSLAFDSLALAFVVTLGADARAQRRIAFGGAQTIDPAAFDPPARLAAAANVSIGQTFNHQIDKFSGLRGVADILVNWGGFGGVTLSTGFDYDADGAAEPLRRREVRLTKDLFESAVRLTAGEFSPPIAGFQGADRILGVSAGRAYSVIRPFQNIRPSGRRDFVLDRRSFVEVEVNGVVVERLQLEPGPYALSDFPFAQGANTVRLLADDGTGRREIAEFDLFGGAGLLDKGVVDFGISVGAARDGGEFRYDGGLAFSGYLRKGLSDSVSAGAAAQWVDDRGMIEASTTWGSRLGLLELGVAASHNRSRDASGVAASLDYLREVSLFERDDTRIVLTAQAYSRDFQTAFERFAAAREAWRLAAQISSRIDRYTVNLGAALVGGRGARSDERAFDLSIGRSFGRYGLSLSLGRREIENRPADNRAGLALTVGLGRRWNAQARLESDQDFREVTLRRSSNGELGDVSGGLRLSEDSGRQTIGGDVRYINNRFDAEVITNRLSSGLSGGTTTAESVWRVSSLFALADGVFAVGRPAREGFVIARLHPSLEGSRLALTDGNGRQIARDGWFGPAVAPIDRAYSVNRFEKSVDPLPEGYDLGTGMISVFPGYGNGYAAVVGSDASRTALGVLILPDGSPAVLLSGTIETVSPSGSAPPTRPFFTNRAGRFVGDGLAAGRYRLVVGGKTVGEFVITEDSEGVVDVGRVQIIRP